MLRHGSLHLLGLLLLLINTIQSYSYSERNRPNIDVSHYPLMHMEPVIGNYFSGNVTSNTLTCFGNRDVEECSYLHTFMCMLPGVRVLASSWVQCDSLWGSRSVVVQVQGNVEFLQMSALPEESGVKKKKGASVIVYHIYLQGDRIKPVGCLSPKSNALAGDPEFHA